MASVAVFCPCSAALAQQVQVFRKNRGCVWLVQGASLNASRSEPVPDLIKTKEVIELDPLYKGFVQKSELGCQQCKKVVGCQFDDYVDCSDRSFEERQVLCIRLNSCVTTEPEIPDDTPPENVNQVKRTWEAFEETLQREHPSEAALLTRWSELNTEELQHCLTALRHTVELVYGELRRQLVTLAEALETLKQEANREQILKKFFNLQIDFEAGGLKYLQQNAQSQNAWANKLTEASSLAPTLSQHERTWLAAVRSTRNVISHDPALERLMLRAFVRYTASGSLDRTLAILREPLTL